MEEREIKDRDPDTRQTGTGRQVWDGRRPACIVEESWIGRRGFVMGPRVRVYVVAIDFVPGSMSVLLRPLRLSTPARTHSPTRPMPSPSSSGTSLFSVSTSCPPQRHATKRNGNETLCRIPGDNGTWISVASRGRTMVKRDELVLC